MAKEGQNAHMRQDAYVRQMRKGMRLTRTSAWVSCRTQY